ncbi:MAG: SAM-dependent methyltransferase [Chloroflexi bacterium]|nr:SAM-dependent methyltransferase [Chloroflexota bacterium]
MKGTGPQMPEEAAFDDEQGTPGLVAAIRQEIAAAGGRITFARFMGLALYHPEHGYYRRPARDYQTSPELHPLFGLLVGCQLAQMWEVLGRPVPFQVVEMGAGRGHLARSVLAYFHQEAPAADLHYIAVDIGPRPAGLPEEVEWREVSLGQWPPSSITGCLVSNELVDAFAVHRVVMKDGALQEVYVVDAGADAGPERPSPWPSPRGRGDADPPSPRGRRDGNEGQARGREPGDEDNSRPSPPSPLPRRERGEGLRPDRETGPPSPFTERSPRRVASGEGPEGEVAGAPHPNPLPEVARGDSPWRGEGASPASEPAQRGSRDEVPPFREVLGPPSTPALAEHFAWLGIDLPEGHRAEVNLQARRWMGEVARVLARGFVVTVDYGYPAEELYSRAQGTLLCYHQQQFNDDPYRWVGQQDITAHVDFSALADAGREAGLHFSGLVSQAEFLRNLGLDGYQRSLEQARAGGRITPAHLYDQRSALRELVDRRGLGAFKVLLQHRGVVEPCLDGVDPTNRRKRLLWSRPPSWPWQAGTVGSG